MDYKKGLNGKKENREKGTKPGRGTKGRGDCKRGKGRNLRQGVRKGAERASKEEEEKALGGEHRVNVKSWFFTLKKSGNRRSPSRTWD